MSPASRINKKALAYGVVLIVALFLFYVAENFEFERVGNRIGPNAWPAMILGLLIVVSGYGLVTSVFIHKVTVLPTELDAEAEAFIRPPEIYPHLVWLGIFATFGYLIVMPIIGFFLSTILFAAILVYLGQYRNFRHIAILSVCLALAFMFLFMRVVYVALPVGIEPFARVSIAIMSAMGIR